VSKRSGLFHQDEVILHLHAHGDIPEGMEGPYAATREGMSESLGMRLNHMSREVQLLVRSGVLVSRLAHVLGFRKKVKVYRLSGKGKERAEGLIASLKDVVVALPDEFGNIDALTLDAAYKKMGGRRGYLDILRMRRVDARAEAGTPSAPAKETDVFLGRKDELSSLSSWLTDGKTGVLVVYGIAGIGKTSLVSRFAGGLKGWRRVYLKVREWDSPHGVLQTLANSLAGLGDERLQTLLRSPEGDDMTNVSFVIGDVLTSLKLLLILDDVWVASRDVWRVIMLLIDTIPEAGSRIVLIAREFPSHLEGGLEARGSVARVRLEGLSEEESRQLLEWRGVTDRSGSSIPEIVRTLHGHPLLLKMVRGAEDIRSLSEGDVSRFIHKEIYARLSQEERSLINTLAVMRYPVDAVLLSNKVGYDVLASLKRKSLAETIGDKVSLHDIMRSFALAYMKEDETRRCHLLAREVLAATGQANLEMTYHAMRAGLVDEAIAELASKLEDLIADGHAIDMLGLLEGVSSEGLSTRTQRSLSLIKMACLAFTGKYRSVISIYEQASEWVRSDPKAMLIAADSYVDIGSEREAGRIYTRMKRLALSKKATVEIHQGLGKYHQNFGRYDAARRSYRKALEISRGAGLEDMIGRSLMGLGAVEVMCSRWNEGNRYLLEGMKHVRRDANTLARLYANLSLAYYQRSMYSIALEMLERAEHMFNRSGNYVASLKSLLNRGTILLVMERREEAEGCMLKAGEMSRRAGIRPLLAGSLMNLSSLYNNIGRFERARELAEEALAICTELNDERGKVVCNNNLALALVSLGRSKEGIRLFRKNLVLSEKLGALGLVADTIDMLAEGYFVTGDKKRALEYGRKALNYAREKGITKVLKSAEKLLKKIEGPPS
jgi:tetratricopeptide (TPR) repeat protein